MIAPTLVPPSVKPKPRRIRVWKDGERILIGTRPGSCNWYDVIQTREQVAVLIADLAKAMA